MGKNSFLKQYLEIPNENEIRNIIFALAFFINIINILFIGLYEITILHQNFGSYFMQIYFKIIIIIDIMLLIVFIFPNRFSNIIFVIYSLIFSGSSILFLCLADMTFFKIIKGYSIFYIIISICIYLFILSANILSIKNKINNKKKYNKSINNTKIVAFLGSLLGIYLSRKVGVNNLLIAFMFLALSYVFAFSYSGFYRFYLIKKLNIECNNNHTES
ncbi:MAG TPA: hypothetical protein VN258_00685 [Mobilitalea sp.]|nr:hypothetical protein [Mobilitalea sp.]